MAIFHDRMGKELSVGEAGGKISNRLYNYFADFFIFFFGLLCYIPSHHFRRFILRLCGAKIGKDSSIHMGVSFFSLKQVKIGEDTIIGRNAVLDGRASINIGSHVDIASDVMIYNSEHDIHSEDFHASFGEVEIGDYTFVGPRAIILPGVKIGKGAVVAAGAVVTGDVEEFSIVGGVPAEVIGKRKITGLHYRVGRARLFQ